VLFFQIVYGGRACKPDSVGRKRVLTIIPLGRSSRYGSSSLPEGCSRLQACTKVGAASEGAPQTFVCFARRAGPALPSYLALHHAGFSLPRLLPDERWALTPPFHPYQQKRFWKTMSRFPCRPSQKLTLAAVYFLWHFPWAATAITFRWLPIIAPLALPGALPISLLTQSGVRTFLPPRSCSAGL